MLPRAHLLEPFDGDAPALKSYARNRNKRGRPWPLIFYPIVEGGDFEMFEILLSAGADVNALL